MDNTERDRLARKGAEVELAELDRRRSELLAFLGRKKTTGEAPAAKTPRKPMAPEDRKALSDKMKRKWEEKQKEKAAAEPTVKK